jgi:starch synthase (maltosyl-transferring)
MMPMGFEYGWARRISVVPQDDETAESPRFDLGVFIAAVNRLKQAVPALNEEGPQRLLSRPSDPLIVLLRQSESGAERAFTLVNTQEHEPREVAVAELLDTAGLAHLGDRLLVNEMPPGGEVIAAPARFPVMPLEVKVLRATLRPVRQVPIGPCEAGHKPAHHTAWRPEARILIENVYPEIDAGRYPAKRVVGDTVEVWADLFRDGHDKLAAVLKYAFQDEDWRETPFAFHDNDRWVARFQPDRAGRWRYTIEAWTGRFESWRDDVAKKLEARQDLDLEFSEGAALVETAAVHAGKEDTARLRKLLEEFAAATGARRAELMLSPELREAMARADGRADLVRYGRELELVVDRPEARFAAWYEMFPRSQGKVPGQSATFDDCIERLGEVAALGFDTVYLVPIHPIGRVNRKGRDNAVTAAPDDPGSPYAIGAAEGGHTAVDPQLGTLADFRRFVAAAAGLGIEVALDFAIQCAPDHPWVAEHKRWFRFRPDGSIYAENSAQEIRGHRQCRVLQPDREGL